MNHSVVVNVTILALLVEEVQIASSAILNAFPFHTSYRVIFRSPLVSLSQSTAKRSSDKERNVIGPCCMDLEKWEEAEEAEEAKRPM
jgi:hypothetical protein